MASLSNGMIRDSNDDLHHSSLSTISSNKNNTQNTNMVANDSNPSDASFIDPTSKTNELAGNNNTQPSSDDGDSQKTLTNEDFVLQIGTVNDELDHHMVIKGDIKSTGRRTDRQGFEHHSELSSSSSSSLDQHDQSSTSSSATFASSNLPSPPLINPSSHHADPSPSSNPTDYSCHPPSDHYFRADNSHTLNEHHHHHHNNNNNNNNNNTHQPNNDHLQHQHQPHRQDLNNQKHSLNQNIPNKPSNHQPQPTTNDPDHHSHNPDAAPLPFNLDTPVNPYSVTQSPKQLSFIMPAFAQTTSNHPLSLDGPAYAEPMLSSPFLDSHSFFNPQACLAPSDHSNLNQNFFSDFSTNLSAFTGFSNSNFQINTSSLPTPNLSNSSAGITPPASSISQPPDINLDGRISSFPSPKLHPLSCSPPTDAKYGFSQHFHPRLQNPYAQTGFDLMGALARVVNRPQPKINIGPVDASAALVVVDAKQKDFPIVFASPSFSLLTGYETSEIIGQNCRFLQKPFNSHPLKKSTNRPTECPATLQIRSHIHARREIQSSIINYRKNGQPFINLVTVIPIAWNSPDINYFVGFQADIASLTGKLGIPPSPRIASIQPQSQLDPSKAIAALFRPKSPKLSPIQSSTISPGPSSPTLPIESHQFSLSDVKNLSCHYDTMLNESRDLILAISLKGTLFYVSPSCKNLLGYEEEELVNGNISKLCHPGDLTGILRQLKLIGNTPHTPIDLIFRALDRDGNFFWLESQGQLHVEVGKGRKYLVVVGRPREIGPLSWKAIRSAGGLGTNEFWMKLSLDGLCLFATTPVRDVLAFEPSEMLGKSLTQLSSPEEQSSIIQALRSAYEGNEVVTLGYSLKDKSNMPVQVISDFYPPHYSGGPRACGMPLPPPKMTNPPRFIFCQTNTLSSAMQRTEKFIRDGPPTLPLSAKLTAKDSSDPTVPPELLNLSSSGNPSSGYNLNDPSIPNNESELPRSNSEDDLFSALATSKSTPWNYEFSQLKRQNHKLHSEISQRGLVGRLRPSTGSRNHAMTSKGKTPQSSRTPSYIPYPPRHRTHQSNPREVADSGMDPDHSNLYFDDRTMLRFNPGFATREDTSTKTLDDLLP